MRIRKKMSLLVLVVSIGILVTACGNNAETGENKGKGIFGHGKDGKVGQPISVGLESLDGVFSPFYGNNDGDALIVSSVFDYVCEMDENGNPVDRGGSVAFEEIQSEDGQKQYLYTVTVKKDMHFTDGEEVTIDDVLAYYYICADPLYDGNSKFGTLDIVGMQEYRYDLAQKELIENTVDAYRPENISQDDFEKYIVETRAEGWYDGIDMTNGGPLGDGTMTWNQYCAMAGVATLDEMGNVTDDSEMAGCVASAEWINSKDMYDPFAFYESQIIEQNLEDGIDVEEITGITKVDEYTCTILLNSVNIYTEREIAYIPIIPEHYYCSDYTKGNPECIKQKSEKPIGSGKYRLDSYENNTVTLNANEEYHLGCPEIPAVEYRIVDGNEGIELILSGQMDCLKTNNSKEIRELLEQHSQELTYNTKAEPGFGYLGINSVRVNDVNVRKGLMHLMDIAGGVKEYYGEDTFALKRTMSSLLPEYPDSADYYYEYSVEKAKEYFAKAGYIENGDSVIQKGGESLELTIGICNTASHPAASIVKKMEADMQQFGGKLTIQDLSYEELQNQVKNQELDMWVMAYDNMEYCDLTPMFGNKGVLYSDNEWESVQKEIIGTTDVGERTELIDTYLNFIMEEAVCMPIYQKSRIEVSKQTD